MSDGIEYRLSGVQEKELLIRGTEIKIALPVPPHEIDDPVEWARSVLPRRFALMVSQAEEDEVCVSAIKRGSDMLTLTDHCGAITDSAEKMLLLHVSVVIATLTPPGCRHRSNKSPQWPRSVNFFGNVFP